MKKIIIPIEERLEDIPESTLDWKDDYEGQLLKVSTTILERYSSPKYEIDKIMSSFATSLFNIDPLEQTILGIIAREGPLKEENIVRIAFKKNADYTRDRVRYRLKHRRSSETLLTLGFVALRKGKKIGNIKSKSERIYHLTLKGLIGSLPVTKFEHNYMVKKFKDSISKFVNSYNVPAFSIQFMKYHLALFMLKNVLEGSKLTDLKNIESDMYTMNAGDPLLSPHFPQKIENSKIEIAIDVRVWFHVYSQVLNKLIKKIVDDGWKKQKRHGRGDFHTIEFPPETNYASNVLPSYLREWYDIIERLQFKDLDKFDPHTIPYENEDALLEQTGLKIDQYAVNIIAKRILKQNNVHPNFSLVELPTFIE